MIGQLEDTARALLSSAGAASVSQVWRVGVTLATHIALRRMIPPEELGPWYWLEPCFLLLSLVRDLGVPAHVVRDEDYFTGNRIQRAAKTGAKKEFLFGRNEAGGQRFHGWVDRLVAAETGDEFDALFAQAETVFQR